MKLIKDYKVKKGLNDETNIFSDFCSNFVKENRTKLNFTRTERLENNNKIITYSIDLGAKKCKRANNKIKVNVGEEKQKDVKETAIEKIKE